MNSMGKAGAGAGTQEDFDQQFEAQTGLNPREDLLSWMGDAGVFVSGTDPNSVAASQMPLVLVGTIANSDPELGYAIIGGRGSMLGPIIGSGLLVWATNVFSIQGEYSQGLFGVLIIVVVMLFRPQGLFPSRRRAAEFETGVHDEPIQDVVR